MSDESWEQEETFYHCERWDACLIRWAKEYPDSRLYEPWEWCRCSTECSDFREVPNIAPAACAPGDQ